MAAVLVDVAAHPPFTTSFWAFLAVALPAVTLCLGVVTPYASTITCLIELVAALRYGGQYVLNLITSGINTADLGMLGPVVLARLGDQLGLIDICGLPMVISSSRVAVETGKE
jgi:hypothetical protein